MSFNNLLSKENALIFFSVLIICISIFGIPSENYQYLVIVILPVVALVIIQKVSQLEFIRHFFIKISLLNIEIRLQKINLNYDYCSLPEKAKKEIDKIDQHFKEYLTDYVSSSIVVMIYLLLFATWSSGYISLVGFEIGEHNVKTFYILLIMLALNMLVMFDSHDQAKQYMQELKEIYRRYGGSDDTNR